MQRLVVVGTSDTELLGKNPEREYLLLICTVPNVYISFAREATTNDLPLTAAMASFELPTMTFIAVRRKDILDAFFQEIHAIGSAVGSAVYVVEG